MSFILVMARGQGRDEDGREAGMAIEGKHE